MLGLGFALLAGCSTIKSAIPNNKSHEHDPMLGDKASAAGPRSPAAPGSAARRDDPFFAPVSATLPPAPAALTVRPPPSSLGKENYLGIDGAAPGGQPIRQTQWNGNQTVSLEQAHEMLRARGVTWQMLDAREGEWHFRCSIPNRENPNLSRFYEARAADELSAILAVIDKIDAQR